MASDDIVFRPLTADEVDAAYEIEIEGFPSDEAGSLSTMRYRQKVGSAYFIGGFLNTHELVGYVSGTLTRSPTLTHDSMSVHEADGTTLAIHSVCVSPHHRRKGLASRLLGKYLEAMATREEVKRVALICHEELIPLYHKAGFELVGKSEVVHGPRGWFEMRHDYQR